jgi:hypothetical protein
MRWAANWIALGGIDMAGIIILIWINEGINFEVVELIDSG